jgi:hypothetical protein
MKRMPKNKQTVDEQLQTKLLDAIGAIRQVREHLAVTNDPTASLQDQLIHWHRVRQFYDVIKELANEAEKFSKYMSYEQLPLAFRQSRVNTRSITLDGIGRFALSSRTTAKVIDQVHANTFLRNHKRGDAIREMVPASTMNSIVAELIKEGIEPDRERDGIEANTYAYTSFTKD